MPRPSRRHVVLDATIELITRDGAAPTMDAIAEAAGMSRQALYHHFDRAEDLFLAMIERIGERHGLREWMLRVFATEDPDERLRTYLDFLAAYWDEAAPVAVAVEAVGLSSAAARHAWFEREGRHRDLVRDMMQRYADAGRLHARFSVEEAADVLWSLATAQHHQHLRAVCGWSRDRYREHLQQVVEHLLLDEHAIDVRYREDGVGT